MSFAEKIKHEFDVPKECCGLEHTCSKCGEWVHPKAVQCTRCKKVFLTQDLHDNTEQVNVQKSC